MAAAAPVLAGAPDGPVLVAVSGGSDSLALLNIVTRWAAPTGRPVVAVTVDHRLRRDSDAEAAWVAEVCAGLGVPHSIVSWDASPKGNLQAEARVARRRLLSAHAGAKDAGGIALGHTQDDQAETLMMRLARGSGVDGLAAMQPVTVAQGRTWLRPLLGVRREALRAALTAIGQSWIEDPSNADLRFDRVRLRAAWPLLRDLGLEAGRLAATAHRMAEAREVLDSVAAELADRAVQISPFGFLSIDRAALLAAASDTRLRLVAAALCGIGGLPYRPRQVRLRALVDAVAENNLRGTSLHGCVIRMTRGQLVVRREPAATSAPVTAGQLWDNRWRTAAIDPDLSVSALGNQGLEQCDGWRDAGIPREVAITLPAFRKDGCLVAAPLLKESESCHASFILSATGLFARKTNR